jgi:hypothetical protein
MAFFVVVDPLPLIPLWVGKMLRAAASRAGPSVPR